MENPKSANNLDTHSSQLIVAKNQRYHWVDVARGLAVIMVVFHHALPKFATDLGFTIGRNIEIVDQFFVIMRMPALCLISGLFIASANKYHGKAFWGQRVGYFLHLYIVWSIIYILFQLAQGVISDSNGYRQAMNWARYAFEVSAFTWYLFALAFFYAFYRLTKGLNKILIASVLGLFSILYGADIILTASWGWDHIGQYLIYFMIGSWGGQALVKHVDGMKPYRWWCVTFILLGLFIPYALFFFEPLKAWSEALLAPIGVYWFLLTAPYVYRFKFIGSFLQKVGSRTLSIYAMHVVVLSFIFLVLSRVQINTEEILVPMLFFVSCLTAGICLLVWKITYPIMPWLYSAPRYLRGKYSVSGQKS